MTPNNTVAGLVEKWREIAARIRDDMPPESHHEYGECCGNIARLEICARELGDALADIAGLVKNLCMKDEASVMLALANRIVGNAHPAEDARLEVAYEIARYLKLDWPAALASPAPSAGVGVETEVRTILADARKRGYMVDTSIGFDTLERIIAALQHPATTSVSPAYDRELIARMLDKDCNVTGFFSRDAIREQARLLREADNAEAAGIRTVDRSTSVAGDAGELPEPWRTVVDDLRNGGLDKEPSNEFLRGLRAGKHQAADLIEDSTRRLATAEQPVFTEQHGKALREFADKFHDPEVQEVSITREQWDAVTAFVREQEAVMESLQEQAEQPGSAVRVECSHPRQTSDGIFTECDDCGATIPPPAPAADPFQVPKLPGNWPEDASQENGNYECKCWTCGMPFYGHKRRVVCKVCAPAEAPAAEQGDALAEQYRKGWEAGHATAHRIRNALATAPSGVRVDDAMVERFDSALMDHPDVHLGRNGFIYRTAIKDALVAALSGKVGE